jgi:hypothetical protein
MNIKYALAAAMALAATHVPAQGPSSPRAALRQAGDLPIGHDCTITVDPRTHGVAGRPALDPPPGFRPEHTIFGTLIDVGPDWVVVKEGTYTNWISRDRVFSIRATGP